MKHLRTLTFILLSVLVVRQIVHANVARLIDDAGDVGQHVSMTLNADGYPVFAYYDATESALKTAACGDPTCAAAPTIATIDSNGDVGLYPSIAQLPSGALFIAYHDETSDDLKLALCTDTLCSAATLKVLDSSAMVGGYSAAGIQDDGLPMIAYFDQTNSAIKFIACSDSSCDTSTTETAIANVGTATQIRLNRSLDGLPLISYYDQDDQTLNLAHCITATCATTNITILTNPAVNSGEYQDTAIRTDGRPYLAYFEYPSQDLRLIDCSDASCSARSISTIDAADDVGKHLSMIIGPDDYPLIAYYADAPHYDLRFVDCASQDCTNRTVTTLDSSDIAGKYTDMTSAADGSPLIAYYNESDQSLHIVQITNDAPLLPTLVQIDVFPGELLSISLNAGDADNAPVQQLHFAMSGQIPHSAVLNPATGAFSYTPSEAELGSTYTIVFSVSDNGTPSLTTYGTAQITVLEDNHPPVLAFVGDKAAVRGDMLALNLAANDPDAGQTVLYSMTGLPPDATLNPATGHFVWTPGGADVGVHEVGFTVSDNSTSGASDHETIIITVSDQLVQNSRLEELQYGAVFPSNWIKGGALPQSVYQCDTDSPAGSCIFTLRRKSVGAIKQKLDVRWLDAGDTLSLSAYLKHKKIAQEASVVMLKLITIDGAKSKIPLKVLGMSGWTLLTADTVLTQRLTRAQIILKYGGERGNISVDGLRVVVTNAGTDPTRGVLAPPPVAPASWRHAGGS